jgi:hypothetical protein
VLVVVAIVAGVPVPVVGVVRPVAMIMAGMGFVLGGGHLSSLL